MPSKEENHAALKEMSNTIRPISLDPQSSTSPHRILPLSAEAISQIHSSKHITSLQTVVLALLENSLDARSSEVDISVDWRRGGCVVNDNGVGIPRTEFEENGGLGRMYCTSKRAPVGTSSNSPSTAFHGSEGTFLAELGAMSLLSITSMQTGDHDSSTLSLHQGKVITRHTVPPNDPNMPSTCRLHGTNVSVRDLFGNMPVRVKQRALAGETGHEKDWHELKRGVVALLLAWPHPCAVKLRDVSGQHKPVNIVGHHPRVASALTEKSLNQLDGKKAKFDLRDNMPMLFHVGLAPQDFASRWVPLSASTSAFTLKGMICLDPAPTKQCQFLALGIMPCGNGSGNNEFHDAVNTVFANSSFGIVEVEPATAEVAEDTEYGDAYTGKQLQAQKGVDRHPMYCMQLGFRTEGRSAGFAGDNINDATLRGLVGILEAAVTAWLDSHGFRPRKRRRRRNEEQQSPAVASTSTLRQPTGSATKTLTSGSPVDEGPRGTDSIRLSNQDDSSNVRPTSKRRKIVDLSTEDERAARRSRTLQEHEADPSLQSHIRVGRVEGRPHSTHGPVFSVSKSASKDEDGKNRPRTVDSGRIGDAQTVSGGPGAKPPLADGLGDKSRTTDSAKGRASAIPAQPASPDDISVTAELQQMSKSLPTSDEYGGLDDADILQAEENNRNGVVDDSTVPSIEDLGEDDIVSWRDPVSKQLYRVNSRTGVVLPATSAIEHAPLIADTDAPKRKRAGIDTALSSAGRPLSLAKRAAAAAKDGPQQDPTTKEKWLPVFLKEWNNPVFVAQKEEQIPVASIDGPGLLENEGQLKCCARGAAGLHDSVQASIHSAGTKLSKAAFKHAQVIAQVDQKFILCKMPALAPDTTTTGTSSLLVLIDQHAASERIILEDLFNSLFVSPSSGAPTLTIKTSNLLTETSKSQHLRYVISQQEHNLFTQYQSHFTLFGIHYISQPTKPLSHNNTGFHATRSAKQEFRLIVTDLPTVIAERCAKLPTICIDLLRAEVWALHDGSRTAVSHLPSPEEGEPPWVKVLPLLPTKFLAMLQSRSCRSAVMFNDALSLQQCRNLVEDLGKRVFPFGCAHGRVSMVPLVDPGADGAGGFGLGVGGIERDLRWTRKPKEGADDKMAEEDSKAREGNCEVGVLGTWMTAKKVGKSINDE